MKIKNHQSRTFRDKLIQSQLDGSYFDKQKGHSVYNHYWNGRDMPETEKMRLAFDFDRDYET